MREQKYFVYRKDYNGTISFNSEIKGYELYPKNTVNYGIKVNEMVIVKSSLIEKVIKRKIKNKLELYLQFLIEKIDGEDSDDSRIALGDLQKYRVIVNKKYSPYLNGKYLELLNKKFDVIERELKSNIIYNNLEEEVHKSR